VGANRTYYSAPGVATVRWDESERAVVVEWEGWANTAEFRSLLEAEVTALQEHGGSRMLADCRLQRVLNAADQERADEDWIPRVTRAGLKRFAVVLPMSDRAAAHLRQHLGAVSPDDFRVRFFATVEEAREWLHR
jgi:SpoIIAA-like